MVVPNRDLGNIHFLSSAFTTTSTQTSTQTNPNPLPSALEMDINSVDNYDDVRGRTHSPSNVSTRSVSVVSQASSLPYHERMVINNNLPDEDIVEPIDNSQLSYSGDGQGRNCVSVATDPVPPPRAPTCFKRGTGPQHLQWSTCWWWWRHQHTTTIQPQLAYGIWIVGR